MNKEKTKELKEFLNLFQRLDISDFSLDTKKRELRIYYKEDFERLYRTLNAEPMVFEADYGAMPPQWADFDYNNWTVYGNIINNKPKVEKSEESGLLYKIKQLIPEFRY